ncbi:MAG TPA: hypothetical protein VFT24_08735, partial [Vicinamibacterales bacterium]|nr:hypothetical protein [Vicinamibacterales bacterium]
RCETAHLGLAEIHTVQQLVFQLDATGQPVMVGGQPVVIQLRNCTTLSGANSDELDHTTIGDVMPGAGPAQAAFSGTMSFVGGTGRFAAASGSAEFDRQRGLDQTVLHQRPRLGVGAQACRVPGILLRGSPARDVRLAIVNARQRVFTERRP